MLRVVLDTNVLVSAFFYDGIERKILRMALDKKFIIVISLPILDELRRVLMEKFNVDEEIAESYIFRLKQISKIIRPKKLKDKNVRDRDDIKIIECAYYGKCKYIVTGDKDLLSLKKYKEIKIIRSREMLRILLQQYKGD